jgi:SAM-dependent methyltransferase
VEEWRYSELYELEDQHWWFRARRKVVWALLRRAGVNGSPHLLDAGCGTGRNLVEFGRLGEAEGVDASAEAVAFCRRRGLDRVQQAALEELPFEDGRFDLLLATDVIEHLDDDRRALRELGRVAGPRARLLLTVPAYRWLWSQHDESLHHRRRYTQRQLCESLRASGWEPQIRTYFFAALLPGVAAVRILRRLRPSSSPRSDMSFSPPLVSRLLELPSDAEAKLIERGVRLPFGVSLGMISTLRC